MSQLGLAKVDLRVIIRSLSARQNFNLRGYGEGRSDRSNGKGAGNFAKRYVSG
jgi:hypothetical protein